MGRESYTKRKPVGSGLLERRLSEYSSPLNLRNSPYFNTVNLSDSVESSQDASSSEEFFDTEVSPFTTTEAYTAQLYSQSVTKSNSNSSTDLKSNSVASQSNLNDVSDNSESVNKECEPISMKPDYQRKLESDIDQHYKQTDSYPPSNDQGKETDTINHVSPVKQHSEVNYQFSQVQRQQSDLATSINDSNYDRSRSDSLLSQPTTSLHQQDISLNTDNEHQYVDNLLSQESKINFNDDNHQNIYQKKGDEFLQLRKPEEGKSTHTNSSVKLPSNNQITALSNARLSKNDIDFVCNSDSSIDIAHQTRNHSNVNVEVTDAISNSHQNLQNNQQSIGSSYQHLQTEYQQNLEPSGPRPSMSSSDSPTYRDSPQQFTELQRDMALGIGIGSAYVQRLRADAGESCTSRSPSLLPLGLKRSTQMSPLNVRPEFLRKALDIKYTHLPQRMLETEVDDDDDDNDVLKTNSLVKSQSAYEGYHLDDDKIDRSSTQQHELNPNQRSSSPVNSITEHTGRIKLFITNPDDGN